MKKLLALLVVGGLLGLVTGCPPANTGTGPGGTHNPPDKGSKPPKEETVTGKVVSYAEGKLEVMDGDKKKSFTTKDAKVTMDGKEGKWDDVKKDVEVTVTHKEGAASKVDVKKEAAVAPKEETAEGKFVSYVDGTLTLKDDKDKEKTFKAKDVKATMDGKDVKWDEIKKDAAVTVTTKDEKVTKVEVKK